MTLLLTTAVFLLLQSSAVPPPPQSQTSKASIEGFVLRVGTNEPLTRAQITISRAAGSSETLSGQPASRSIAPVTTDNQGHFLITDLEGGSYLITAARNGFARQIYGERAPGRPGTPLNVGAGQAIKDVVFHLTPAGAVNGRITDGTGEPLSGVMVQLVRSIYDGTGRRTFRPLSNARTDDRGEYRFYWITPGRYQVVANAPPAAQDIGSSTNEVVVPGYVTTYYPGTTDSSAAMSIEISPGSELSAIDFVMTQEKTFRIRGHLFNARTSRSPETAFVMIRPRSTGSGIISLSRVQNYNAADGSFELRDVPPGSYWVRAQSFDPPSGRNPNPLTNTAQMAVDVSNSDVENIVLSFTPGIAIPGRISVEGNFSLSTLPGAERMRVFLLPSEPQATFGTMTPPATGTDGTFLIENVPAGDYQLSVNPLPPNFYLKEARLDQTDVTGGITVAGPVSGGLEIVISGSAGQLDGMVLDRDRKPVGGVQTVLIPDRLRDRRDLYRTASADQNGHFVIRTIPPGEYRLFAWEDIEPFAYHDPEFLRRYEQLGTPVTVSESSKLTVETRIIPAGQ